MSDEQDEDKDDDDQREENDDAQRHRNARVASQAQRSSEEGEARGEPVLASMFRGGLLVGGGQLRRCRRDGLYGSPKEIHGSDVSSPTGDLLG